MSLEGSSYREELVDDEPPESSITRSHLFAVASNKFIDHLRRQKEKTLSIGSDGRSYQDVSDTIITQTSHLHQNLYDFEKEEQAHIAATYDLLRSEAFARGLLREETHGVVMREMSSNAKPQIIAEKLGLAPQTVSNRLWQIRGVFKDLAQKLGLEL